MKHSFDLFKNFIATIYIGRHIITLATNKKRVSILLLNYRLKI